MRYLIVNADDLGLSHGVNQGIADAHEDGIVTSASLMVDRPGSAEAAEYARAERGLDVGLHIEVRRWRVARLPRKGAARSAERLRREIASELTRQIDRFRDLVGGDPTHLDSHQHRHLDEVPRVVFEDVANGLGIPLRRVGTGIRFCGDFYGHDAVGKPRPEAITTEALIELLESLDEGVTELCCHPGYASDLGDWYRMERDQEVKALRDPRVRETLQRLDIRLCTFRELPSPLAETPA